MWSLSCLGHISELGHFPRGWVRWLYFFFYHLLLPNSLWPHGLQHAWLPCSSLSPGVCSNSCPLYQCCYLTISSSVDPFSSSSCPQSFPASGFLLMSAVHIRWPEYWSFSFSISPSSGYSGLISFRIDWFDLPAVQGALKSLLQHHNSHSAFFMVQFSHPYMTTGKIIALTLRTYVSKVISLPFNTLLGLS